MILLHHLPATGGSLISRCLGSMPGVCLLSEIHPRGLDYFNPLQQAVDWHGLLRADEVVALQDGDYAAFGQAIELIAARALDRGERLVIRDWSHLDWIARPFRDDPPMQSSWDRVWPADSENAAPAPAVPRGATVRNPIDQYLHSKQLGSLSATWDDAAVWRGMRQFAESVQQMPWFRYEDFLASPAQTLSQMCEVWSLPYDDRWQDRWMNYEKITGTALGRHAGGIRPCEREAVDFRFWSSLRDNDDLYATLDLLDYPLPEPLRKTPAATVAAPTPASTSKTSKTSKHSPPRLAKDWDAEALRWRQAAQENPEDFSALLRWAEALRWLGQADEAADQLLKLLRQNEHWSPEVQRQVLPLVCETLEKAGRKFETIELRRVLAELSPQHCDNLFQLSVLLAGVGEVAESLAYCRRLLELDHQHSGAAANFLLYINYSDEYSAAEIANEHFRLGMRFTERPTAMPPRVCAATEKIRVGYMASDFYTHPVGKIILPILQSHDRSRFHLIAYHDGPQSDATTESTRQAVDQFISIHGWSDERVVEALRRDALDVLIDLGGYTGGGNRLRVFARRVAPVQASFLGYPNTSALPTIDYHLTDRFADPPGLTERLYGEQLVWLDHAILAWRPYEAVGQLAAVERGGPLLGLFNNVAKISPLALRSYAAILRRVPEARLILKYGDRYSVRSLRDRFRREFAAHGVLPHRLEFRTHAESLQTHLQTMKSVDLALDTFPYQGTMTSLECLAVGTPIVSCCGDYYAHRATSAMMMRMGFHELVAEDADEYVEIAVQLLQELDLLRELRAEVSHRFHSGPLTDPPGLTRELEAKITAWVGTRPVPA